MMCHLLFFVFFIPDRVFSIIARRMGREEEKIATEVAGALLKCSCRTLVSLVLVRSYTNVEQDCGRGLITIFPSRVRACGSGTIHRRIGGEGGGSSYWALSVLLCSLLLLLPVASRAPFVTQKEGGNGEGGEYELRKEGGGRMRSKGGGGKAETGGSTLLAPYA